MNGERGVSSHSPAPPLPLKKPKPPLIHLPVIVEEGEGAFVLGGITDPERLSGVPGFAPMCVFKLILSIKCEKIEKKIHNFLN